MKYLLTLLVATMSFSAVAGHTVHCRSVTVNSSKKWVFTGTKLNGSIYRDGTGYLYDNYSHTKSSLKLVKANEGTKVYALKQDCGRRVNCKKIETITFIKKATLDLGKNAGGCTNNPYGKCNLYAHVTLEQANESDPTEIIQFACVDIMNNIWAN